MRTALALVLVTAGSAAAEPMFELGIGSGAFWGHDDIKTTRATTFQAQFGSHTSGKLDVLGGVEGFSGNYSPEPTNEQSVANIVGGVRWYPYGRPHDDDIEPRAMYLQAVAGVSILTLIPYDSFFESNDPDAAGVVGGAALGWMPIRLGNVAFSFEARGNVILYNANAGFRQTLALNLVLQINLE